MKRVVFLASGMLVAVLSACNPVVLGLGSENRLAELAYENAVMPDGARLPLTRWLPSSDPVAAVVALHGFNDHSGTFDDLGAALAEAGVAVFAYDQRGFGDATGRGYWPGSEALISDLATMVHLIGSTYPRVPIYALGESMGAAVIMIALANDSVPQIKGAVFSAPAVWGRSTMKAYKRIALDMLAHIIPALRLSPRGLNIKPSDNVEMLRALAKDPRLIRETRIDSLYGLVGLMDEALAATLHLNQPLLILYGKNDEIVPKRAACRMLAQLPASSGQRSWRTVLYPDGYHMLFRDLAGDLVTRDIVAWFVDPGARIPSGHEIHPDLETGNTLPGFCPPNAFAEQ